METFSHDQTRRSNTFYQTVSILASSFDGEVLQAAMAESTSPYLIGYARVSTEDQNLDLQRDALIGAGVQPDEIYEEKASGGSIAKRVMLQAAFKALRKGDVLVVWKLDRLGRNLSELIQTIQRIHERGAHFRCLTQHIDTTTPMGMLVFHIFGAMAQFERELGRERTIAGLAAARARGRIGGRKPVLNDEKVARARRMLADGKTVRQVATALKISAATVYKWKKLLEPEPPVHDPETGDVRGDVRHAGQEA